MRLQTFCFLIVLSCVFNSPVFPSPLEEDLDVLVRLRLHTRMLYRDPQKGFYNSYLSEIKNGKSPDDPSLLFLKIGDAKGLAYTFTVRCKTIHSKERIQDLEKAAFDFYESFRYDPFRAQVLKEADRHAATLVEVHELAITDFAQAVARTREASADDAVEKGRWFDAIEDWRKANAALLLTRESKTSAMPVAENLIRIAHAQFQSKSYGDCLETLKGIEASNLATAGIARKALMVSVCKGGTKDYLGAILHGVLAIEAAPDNSPLKAQAYFNMACFMAQTNDLKRSVEQLENALKLDSSLINAARQDPDLNPLRSEPGFDILVKKYSR